MQNLHVQFYCNHASHSKSDLVETFSTTRSGAESDLCNCGSQLTTWPTYSDIVAGNLLAVHLNGTSLCIYF